MTTKILLVVVFIIGLVVLSYSPDGGNKQAEFMKTASKTMGHVVDREERGDGDKKEYWVTYSYTDTKGVEYTTQLNLGEGELWQKLRPGQAEPVYFNPKNPSESYLGRVVEQKLNGTR